MMLSYTELCGLVDDGVIDANPALINGASIDVRLGQTLLLEQRRTDNAVIDLSRREAMATQRFEMDATGYKIPPGQFLLAETIETFNLPDDIAAFFLLKSSMARAGLEHSQAGFADPGWHGSVLTMELKNLTQHYYLHLRPGMRIGQIVFFRVQPVPAERSYAALGAYNGLSSVAATRVMAMPARAEKTPVAA